MVKTIFNNDLMSYISLNGEKITLYGFANVCALNLSASPEIAINLNYTNLKLCENRGFETGYFLAVASYLNKFKWL